MAPATHGHRACHCHPSRGLARSSGGYPGPAANAGTISVTTEVIWEWKCGIGNSRVPTHAPKHEGLHLFRGPCGVPGDTLTKYSRSPRSLVLAMACRVRRELPRGASLPGVVAPIHSAWRDSMA